MGKSKSKPIVAKLVMVNLHISVETGRRKLVGIAKQIATENSADVKLISTSIKLIPADKIKSFTTAISRARQYFLSNSLPWEDGNWRVVPVAKIHEFKDDLDKLISEAKDEFQRCFITNYESLKKTAEKGRGKLTAPFPTLEELEESFSIKYGVGAPASPDDIRIIGIDTAMRKSIQQETEARYNKQIEAGLSELTNNLQSALSDIEARVSTDEQKGKKYARFLESLANMTTTIDALNVTENETLTEACSLVRKNISNWSPEAIKTSPEVRKAIKSAVGGIQEQLLGISLNSNEPDGDGDMD